jgi:hypothetical protein
VDEFLKWLMAVGLGIVMVCAIFTLIVLIAIMAYAWRRWRRIRRIERSINDHILGATRVIAFGQNVLTKAEMIQIREYLKRAEAQSALQNDKTENVRDL